MFLFCLDSIDSSYTKGGPPGLECLQFEALCSTSIDEKECSERNRVARNQVLCFYNARTGLFALVALQSGFASG